MILLTPDGLFLECFLWEEPGPGAGDGAVNRTVWSLLSCSFQQSGGEALSKYPDWIKGSVQRVGVARRPQAPSLPGSRESPVSSRPVWGSLTDGKLIQVRTKYAQYSSPNPAK